MQGVFGQPLRRLVPHDKLGKTGMEVERDETAPVVG
jgi:hypothetical protein